VSTEGTNRAIFAAFAANLGIAVCKFVAFAITGSAGMLAESVHSLADTGNQGLLFVGGRRARRAPTPLHPFGYGSERYFWAFVVAVVLFTLGAAFALYEGVDKLRHPHELDSPEVAILVLAVGLVLETLSLRTAIREANTTRAGAGWWHFVTTSKAPEIPVVLFEDAAALLGLVLALLGVSLAEITDDAHWDALGSLGIGLVLGVVALVLAREMKSLLIGESAGGRMIADIHDAVRAGPEVERIIHSRTMFLGPDDLLVALKVQFTTDDVAALAVSIDAVEARIRAAVPVARTIYVEPDLYRAR
jgi:cation diffusion facilitator family transporter